MKYLYILFQLFFTFSIFAESITDSTTNPQKSIKAIKLSHPVVIDGKLSEDVWSNLQLLNMTQRDPDEGKPATEKTYITFAYDETALYIGAKMEDSSPDSIIGRLTRRDSSPETDNLLIAIDSYNDKRSGYYFRIDAAGSIGDGTLFNDDWDSDTWNGVWDYAVQIVKDGWTVEMKIPFSQLRYSNADIMSWGINIRREIARKKERDLFIHVPKKESGFVSKFGSLTDIETKSTPTRLEILPYLVQKGQYLVHDSNDPFYKGKQYPFSFGGDLKYGIGSNMTLDMTINPDFGQVEVDPAVLNLSANESYFAEKRPFFIEGDNLLHFGNGGANNNWGFNWGDPQLFYSRRIGRAPTGSSTHEGFTDYPAETNILGAAKLTGQLAEGWTMYFLDAVTPEMRAKTDSSGVRFEDVVAPLTNYSVFRTRKEFNSSRQSLGFMATAVNRNFSGNSLNNILSQNAFTTGLDGWTFLDEKKSYVLTGYFSGSMVSGTKEYITALQQSPLRYYQRPDSKFSKLDSNATSLSGYIARINLNKQDGNFYVHSAIGIISPGYSINDIGFQWKADAINHHLVVGYREFEPGNLFRNSVTYLAHFLDYNFDGDKQNEGIMLYSQATLLNYYGLRTQLFWAPERMLSMLLRGGPVALYPSEYIISIGGFSDYRNKIVVDGGIDFQSNEFGSTYCRAAFYVDWKVASNLKVNLEPGYEYNLEKTQWVSSFTDVNAVNTYGKRYIFAELNQKTLFTSIRLDWSFTARLSLQFYAQPFFSVGSYTGLKEFSAPRKKDYMVYGTNGSEISYDKENSEYLITPSTKKPNEKFVISNPDFNYKSFRLNMVLRWEYLPGSTLFFVWTRNQNNFDNPADFSLGRDFKNLINNESDNIFLLKMTYWFSL